MKKLWNKDYILLLQSSTVSTLGDLMYSVAIGYWVYAETGSSALMGVMSAISMFVTMFLSPFCGSIVDKLNRKWLMVVLDIMQGAVMITVGVFAYMNKLSVAGVLVAALLAALGSVFYSPAANTVLLDIIPRDDMVRGQSVFSASSSLINTVGTALSGVMVAFFGVPLIVIINGLSNLYAAVSETFIKVPKTVRQGEAVTLKGVLRDSGVAVKTIFSEPCLKIFVPFALIINLMSAGVYSLILPFCLQKGFSVDMYGYLMSVTTVASLICAVLLGILKLKPRTRFLVMSLGFSLSVLFHIATYLSNGFIFVCIFGFLGIFLNCAGNSVFNASLMLALPEENRGAMMGFIQSACVGGTAISTVIYGVLCDIFPIHIVFTVGSLLSLLPMIMLCFNPKVKNFILTN